MSFLAKSDDAANEAANEAADNTTSEAANEAASEATNDATSEAANENASEAANKAANKAANENANEAGYYSHPSPLLTMFVDVALSAPYVTLSAAKGLLLLEEEILRRLRLLRMT